MYLELCDMTVAREEVGRGGPCFIRREMSLEHV